MYDALPAEVEVVPTAGGTRYVLPPTPVVPRGVGLALLVFGLMPVGMGATFLAFTLRTVDLPFPGNLVLIPFLLIPAGFVLVGLTLIFAGAYFLVGRNEIELSHDTLGTTMRVGPLRWTWRRQRHQVRSLVVEYPRHAEGPRASHCTLTAECHRGRSLFLALGHPHDLLTTLADHLAQRWTETGGETLPVRQVERTTTGSRAWQRREAAPGPVAGGCGVVFALLFFGVFLTAGCLSGYFIFTTLLRGDPGNNLEGPFPFKYLWALFPLPFLAVGAGGILYQLRARSGARQSPEQKAAGQIEAPEAAVEEEVLPAVPVITPTTGRELAYRLAWRDSPGCAVAGFGILLLLCSGVLTPFVYNVVEALRAGRLQGVVSLSGFVLLFFGFVWVGITGALIHNWRLWRLGQPIVEISHHPLHPGESCELFFALPGTMRLGSLQLSLVCEEVARYREGTNTRTETRCVYREHLVDSSNEPLVLNSSHRFRVPPEAMHSFEAANNQVRWAIRVAGRAAGVFGPRIAHDFPLVVHPPREGKTR